MKITFNLDSIEPMIDWLLDSKKNNGRDENRLKEILNMPDYQIEFERYGLKNLPVCGISYDEAVDFFMNFDKKEFDNQRLEIKKKYFLDLLCPNHCFININLDHYFLYFLIIFLLFRLVYL